MTTTQPAQSRTDGSGRFNPVVDILEAWAAESPDDLALVSLDGQGDVVARQTSGELAREARKAARTLADLGVRKGDRIFVMLPRTPAWYSAVLGAIRLGAVPLPGPNLLTDKDIAYRINRAQATVAITDAEGAAKIERVLPALETLEHKLCDAPQESIVAGWSSWPELCAAGDGPTEATPTRADDAMLIYFTSGTVWHPKMVLHTQTSYGLGHENTARLWHDLRPGDVHWAVSDSGWAKAAYGSLFGQWQARATVLQVALGKPEASTILRILQEHKVISFCAPPTLYRLLVQADLKGFDLRSLRSCTSAGEPLNPEVIRLWQEGTDGLVIRDGYGQTETTLLVANVAGAQVRPGSMGRPMPGYDVQVLDDKGEPAGPGEVGNIVVRTSPRPVGLFAGYYQDEDATAGVFRDGWYFTGDKAARDVDGYFWFEGRSDDVITSSAYRIGPFEVESALIEHPAVAEAAVVGKPDAERTELVTAFVILAPGCEPSPELAVELQEHVKRVTAPYKYPRLVSFVDELPKTVSGKIRRSELRARLAAGELG